MLLLYPLSPGLLYLHVIDIDFGALKNDNYKSVNYIDSLYLNSTVNDTLFLYVWN